MNDVKFYCLDYNFYVTVAPQCGATISSAIIYFSYTAKPQGY